MAINVNLTISFAGTDILQQILDGVNDLKKGQTQIMADLTQLTADVAAETTIDESVETLLTSLSAEITAAGTDPVALKALTDKMEANAATIVAAITANTPATSTPPVVAGPPTSQSPGAPTS